MTTPATVLIVDDEKHTREGLRLSLGLPMMPLDANQMKQAFYNLIRNACQVMPEGGTREPGRGGDEGNDLPVAGGEEDEAPGGAGGGGGKNFPISGART